MNSKTFPGDMHENSKKKSTKCKNHPSSSHLLRFPLDIAVSSLVQFLYSWRHLYIIVEILKRDLQVKCIRPLGVILSIIIYLPEPAASLIQSEQAPEEGGGF